MLPFALDAIDKAALERACADKWAEGPRLDFKRDLPGRDNSAKNEFLKDVAAMANAEGGDLVYGIDEAEGAASVLAPITTESSDDAFRRLGQILDSSIEPRVGGIQMKAVQLEPGYCLVVRVPASYDGPHSYSVNGISRFVLRNNTHTPEMSYDQLRDAFGRRASLQERASAFIAARGINAVANNLPYFNNTSALWVVHLVPLAGIAGRIAVDVAALHKDHQGFRLDAETAWKRTPNFQGLALHEGGDGKGAHVFVQVFRNGAVESMVVASTDHYAGNTVVVGLWLADHLTEFLTVYAAEAKKWSISGPGVLGLTLLQAKGTSFSEKNRTFNANLVLHESHLQFPPMAIDEVSALPEPRQLIRPLLETVFQSYGNARCSFYDDAGKWVGERGR